MPENVGLGCRKLQAAELLLLQPIHRSQLSRRFEYTPLNLPLGEQSDPGQHLGRVPLAAGEGNTFILQTP
jgi:hypothetical protein